MSNSPAGEASVPAPRKLERSASTFTVTCNLLSQFLKDRKGAGFGDLALGIGSRNQDSADRGKTETLRTPPTTMSLLPGPGVDGETGNASGSVDLDLFPLRASFAAPPSPAAAENAREPEKNQLTIFYGGKVLVFNNFPANKAMDLLNLASKKSAAAENHTSTAPAIAVDPPKSVSLPNTNLPSSLSVTPPARAVQPTSLPSAGGSEMPIARRASLHRFLEKRKDRVNSKAPYEVNGSSGGGGGRQAAKPEESMKWLGLGPQSSKS
ncbi:hypothetical protein J5N97_005842 [Dioscorea zingiberensis]|uniref:Protein TIFY n=1 Tax=Dioscorea zingiberensis TaxID=325984 RepID=A0A9D5D8S4_9LILI|nr:hypothetical protein J5N97_005842 [Dioscorea zingiberensis]